MHYLNSYSYYLDAIVNDRTGETIKEGSASYENLPVHVKKGHVTMIACKAAHMLRDGVCSVDFIRAEIALHWPKTINEKEFMALVVKRSIWGALIERRKNVKVLTAGTDKQ